MARSVVMTTSGISRLGYRRRILLILILKGTSTFQNADWDHRFLHVGMQSPGQKKAGRLEGRDMLSEQLRTFLSRRAKD